ncbi:DUF1149 family protein [Loigolactobacillus coryniformis]|jgi:hypothetical protein|uniref:DUF1149 family protein n=4 Tax=Loigolactobacillus coryniformis TaxID=1610 RepID=J2Z4F7_9LACO|nr:DUF1149 family protein [Loigolactobacillus coryniformis]MDT3392609.1 DUF1149 family protein [Bacillota bacterium]OEH90090.1 hypothetical protein ATO00_06925 [Loigolactobacillus coryniformis subsp. coryniformis]RRG02894.1 MAG: DUF1149 family protein [Lactobacillus sp.]ATO44409.1 hypothetical protein LC20004_11095 [Loigolactobacillus coryniformis subsp. torquens DSM 20004 = KCTC 3535]ATO56107.1 hypothetical protein LC20001_10965 [Loigolactobacillus coryniformis subsp. coryniformis KCTC 3167 =
MKTNREQVVVEHFHYDRVAPDTAPKTDVQVNINEVTATGDGADEIMARGKIFQFAVPFEVVLEGFAVSGQITQIIQILDFNGTPDDLAAADMQRLSRPLVEYIETLTYQVTAVALDQGVQLDFHAEDDDDSEPFEKITPDDN